MPRGTDRRPSPQRLPVGALVLFACCTAAIPAPAQELHVSEQASFRVVELASGLEFPWSLAFLPDGDLLITEKPGRLRRWSGGRLDPTPVAGVPPVVHKEDGGLMDVVLHPDFDGNGRIYLCFGHGTMARNALRVASARLAGTGLDDLRVVIDADNVHKEGAHLGCRMVFDRDGYLFVSVGDRYDFRDEAQDPSNLYGTILRLRDDGGIPADNPFARGGAGRPEVWSWGHRNPQGAALHPRSGKPWFHEHGPKGGDEINIPRAGRNYGWPAATYGIDYDDTIISEHTALPGIEQPIWYWLPSIAPSGMAFYGGTAFPRWNGDLFVGAMAAKALVRLELDGERVLHEERLLTSLGERIRDVRTGPDGLLYLLTDSERGRLLRLEPAPQAARSASAAIAPARRSAENDRMTETRILPARHWPLLAAALFTPVPVHAADPAPAGATCVKVVRAGSRIPQKVCAGERDLRGEVTYPLPGVTPADRVRRLDERIPWLTIYSGTTRGGGSS
jgi:glucose/arabinose dehydrogenase